MCSNMAAQHQPMPGSALVDVPFWIFEVFYLRDTNWLWWGHFSFTARDGLLILRDIQLLLQLSPKPKESSKTYANRFLDADMPVSMLVVEHLSTYCNCYVNETLVSISSSFPFFWQNVLFTSLHYYTKTASLWVFTLPYSLEPGTLCIYWVLM